MKQVDKRPVLLVCPPSLFFKDDRQVPTLSHLYVAAALQEVGIPVDVLDLPLVGRDGNEDDPAYLRALEEAIATGPDYQAMGVTALSPQMREVVRIGQRAKMVKPDMLCILGGAHPTLDHECAGHCGTKSCTPDQPYDKVVVGDGEEAILFALDRQISARYIHANQIAKNIPRITDTNRPLLDDLSAIVPARELTDIKSYTMKIKDRSGDPIPATTIMTQRGCPFGCTFCGGRDTAMYRLRRTRNPEVVLAELAHIRERLGYRGIVAYDDEVNLPPWDIFFDLMNRLSGEDFILRGFVKAELFTDKVAEAMVRAGFVEVATGVESGSGEILKNIKKNTTPEINTRAAETAVKHGMRFKAFLSVGHPGETDETICCTRDWALDEISKHGVDCVLASVSLISPYPGTPIFDRARSLGHLGFALTSEPQEINYAEERTFALADGEEYNCLVRTDLRWNGTTYQRKADGLSPAELIEARSMLDSEIRQAQNGVVLDQYSKSMGQQ